MSKNSNGGGLTQRLLLAVIAAGVVIIACLLGYEAWNKRRAEREAETALREFEKNKPERVRVDMPQRGGDAVPSPTPDQLIVTLEEGGAIRLSVGGAREEVLRDADQLRARLEEILRERRERGLGGAVFVKADLKVRYTGVVKIIEAARRAGADSIGLQPGEAK